MLSNFNIDHIIRTALSEDINYIDLTTDLLVDPDSYTHATLVAKADGVLAGIDVALRAFSFEDDRLICTKLLDDCTVIKKGDIIAEIEGPTASILKTERTALNILSHMCGIATYTKKCVDMVEDLDVSITDTRKTLPGLRPLQKYAVLCGGGNNHRYNLSAAAMIKDNHIDAYGSVSNAIETLRERAGHMVVIEVEVRDLDELKQAIEAGALVIMLDNFDKAMLKEAVKFTAGRAILEVSGNITLENINEIAKTGIPIISIGALTHTVKALDISLRIDKSS
jgi:nicotinate-nucleotide pyrophosphorylase (carboxylating)